MFGGIISQNNYGFDIEMEVDSVVEINLNDYHEGTRAPDTYWTLRDRPSHSGLNAEIIDANTLRLRAIRPTRKYLQTTLRNSIGNPVVVYQMAVDVVLFSNHFRTHPEDKALARHPRRTGFLLIGEGETRARYPVQCKAHVHLAQGDDGEGDAIVYSDRYIRPDEQFLFPDDHVGVINSVRPVYLHATGERIASYIHVRGIKPREVPESGCIDSPPARIEVDSDTTFSSCTHDPGATYKWDAWDDEGNPVGSWANDTTARATFAAPPEPGLIHITLVTNDGEHEHVHGVRVWVEPEGSDYFPAAIPQPVQPGDAYDLKRYQIDVRYEGMTLALSGSGVEFKTAAGVPITEPVENPPVGPFDFTAQGRAGTNATLNATVHGVVNTSLFTL